MFSKKLATFKTCLISLTLILLSTSFQAVAEDSAYTAETAKNPDISVEDLADLLLPMDKSQLEVEAAAWQDVLAKKVQQISELEIKNRTDTPVKAQADPATELDAEIAVQRVEQAGINKRFETVLNALDGKGGDVKDQRLYLDAVSGIKLDADDTTVALLALKEWAKSEDGGRQLLVNLALFVAAIIVVVFLSRLAGRATDRIVKNRPISQLLENFIKVAVRRTVLAVGIIISLPIIGINIGPVLALIGAAGLVIGLALQGTLSNFASGVLILIYRPYDMNDAVQVDSVSGTVSTMNLLFTTIKTFDNQLITIPNNNVWDNAIVNITGSTERRVDMVFGIGYGDDFTKAQKILADILDSHPQVLKEPAATIRMHELADSSVNIICRPWVKTPDYWAVHWDVLESVKREFDAQGISIPFPQRDVHFFPAEEKPAA